MLTGVAMSKLMRELQGEGEEQAEKDIKGASCVYYRAGWCTDMSELCA